MKSTLPMRPALSRSTSASDDSTRVGTGTAHAKAILFGEHAVVYGAPAIAVPLHGLEVQADIRRTPVTELRIESELFAGAATAAPAHMRPVIAAVQAAVASIESADERVELRIRSAIPHGRGLGSSAAVATAITRAIADLHGVDLSIDERYAVVQQAERVAHGNPSGIDARAVAALAPIIFRSGEVSRVAVGAPLTFVLADSGVTGSTAEAVTGVRDRRAADPDGIDAVISRLSQLAEGATRELEKGDRSALGARMTEAHSYLQQLGVSTPTLDALVDASQAAGALGAKLTGGGLGGCVLALANSEDAAEHIALALRAAGASRTWTTEVPSI
ncbi:MAG: mevalonate kinase [Leucobacter sp.]